MTFIVLEMISACSSIGRDASGLTLSLTALVADSAPARVALHVMRPPIVRTDIYLWLVMLLLVDGAGLRLRSFGDGLTSRSGGDW